MDIIRQTLPPTPAQWDLLLDADPDRAKVESYLATGELYVAPDAVMVVTRLQEDEVWEIKNIAIAEAIRGRGHGKALLLAMLALLRKRGARAVEIGTGNSGFDQLALYQKVGFRIIGVWPDFFADYPEPIFENGIECRDMVRMRMDTSI